MSQTLIGVLAGAALAAGTIAMLSRFPAPRQQRLWCGALIVAAALYPVVLAVAGDGGRWWFIETSGLVFFTLVALGGRSGSAGPLVFGWIAHLLWDVGLHGGELTPFVPSWYVPASVVFDLAAAVWIARRLRV